MATGSLSIRVKPIRVAFIIDPTEKGALRQAIQAATTQWGGSFNPIIPAYGRTPVAWKEKPPFRSPSPAQIVEGLAAGFDPDIVVPIGSCQRRDFPFGHREVVPLERFLGDDPLRPRFGVGILSVIESVFNSELKFVRSDQLAVTLPILPRSYGVFLASVLGDLPPGGSGQLDLYLEGIKGIKRPRARIDAIAELLEPQNLFLRRLSAWHLKHQSVDPTLFVCDATSPTDTIDYWNLRASGRYIIPVPVQALGSNSMLELCRTVIVENYLPRRFQPNLFVRATVLKSRSVPTSVLDAFCASLELPLGGDGQEPRFDRQHWIPRIWSRWARSNGNEGVARAYSHEIDIPMQDSESQLDLRSQDPKFDWHGEYTGQSRYANDFSFRFYGAKVPMAEVIPHAGKEMSNAIGRTGFDNWRFSDNGPVFLANMGEDLIFLNPPKADEVMREWMRELGWDVTLSAAGRMALQLTRQLGGLYGIAILRKRGLTELLAEADREGGLPRQAIIGKLRRSAEAADHGDQDREFQGLVESGIMRLGASIQCPTCTRNNWYELDQLRYKAHCRFCIAEYLVPTHSPKDLKWTYRAYGPFSGSAAQGAVCVLLTWSFFAGPHDAATTPIFSYIAKKGAKVLEADLTLLFKPSNERASKVEVVHAECKTLNSFEEADIQRMKLLGEEYPGSILVFSKIGVSLTRSEVSSIRSLAETHRRRRLARRPHSLVIVLTGAELLARRSAPYCWKDKGEKYEKFVKGWQFGNVLDLLSDATLQIYLSMPSWAEELAAFSKRASIRK